MKGQKESKDHSRPKIFFAFMGDDLSTAVFYFRFAEDIWHSV